jgi:hypothetical protein
MANQKRNMKVVEKQLASPRDQRANQLPPIYCRLTDMSCLAKVKSVFSVKLATSAALKSNFQFPHYDSISI